MTAAPNGNETGTADPPDLPVVADGEAAQILSDRAGRRTPLGHMHSGPEKCPARGSGPVNWAVIAAGDGLQVAGAFIRSPWGDGDLLTESYIRADCRAGWSARIACGMDRATQSRAVQLSFTLMGARRLTGPFHDGKPSEREATVTGHLPGRLCRSGGLGLDVPVQAVSIVRGSARQVLA